MSKKAVSIASQSILALIGLIFFLKAYTFNDGSTNAYVGAGYYPMMVSGILTFFSITGILTDLKGKGKGNQKQIDLTNIKNVGLVAITTLFIVFMWQFFGLFYPAAFISLSLLLIFLSSKSKTKKHIVISVIVGAVFIAVTYLVFDLLLQVKV